MHLKHRMEILNRFSTVQVQVVAHQIGPSTVHLYFDTCLGNPLCIWILKIFQKNLRSFTREPSLYFLITIPLEPDILYFKLRLCDLTNIKGLLTSICKDIEIN